MYFEIEHFNIICGIFCEQNDLCQIIPVVTLLHSQWKLIGYSAATISVLDMHNICTSYKRYYSVLPGNLVGIPHPVVSCPDFLILASYLFERPFYIFYISLN